MNLQVNAPKRRPSQPLCPEPWSLADALDANGIAQRPLSSNEYQPADRQTAGDTAWYLARLAQSNYANAMRGNWSCCTIPNLTGLLTKTPSGWAPNGNWWVMRTYADLTGSLVSTSEQVGSTAISASVDPVYREGHTCNATERNVRMMCHWWLPATSDQEQTGAGAGRVSTCSGSCSATFPSSIRQLAISTQALRSNARSSPTRSVTRS